MKSENNEDVLKYFAQQLSKAREELGMKQDTAAKALQISRSTLSKYENGDLRGLTIDFLLIMCSFYQKPLLSFFPHEHSNLLLKPFDSELHNNNQLAYTFHTQVNDFREMILHLKEEINYLRSNLKA